MRGVFQKQGVAKWSVPNIVEMEKDLFTSFQQERKAANKWMEANHMLTVPQKSNMDEYQE